MFCVQKWLKVLCLLRIVIIGFGLVALICHLDWDITTSFWYHRSSMCANHGWKFAYSTFESVSTVFLQSNVMTKSRSLVVYLLFKRNQVGGLFEIVSWKLFFQLLKVGMRPFVDQSKFYKSVRLRVICASNVSHLYYGFLNSKVLSSRQRRQFELCTMVPASQ